MSRLHPIQKRGGYPKKRAQAGLLCIIHLDLQKHKLFYFSDVKFFHKVGSLTKSVEKDKKKEYRGDFFIKQNTRNHVYFLKKIGGVFSYSFIVFLFFKNNIRIFTNPNFRTNFHTWKLINKSYIRIHNLVRDIT